MIYTDQGLAASIRKTACRAGNTKENETFTQPLLQKFRSSPSLKFAFVISKCSLPFQCRLVPEQFNRFPVRTQASERRKAVQDGEMV